VFQHSRFGMNNTKHFQPMYTNRRQWTTNGHVTRTWMRMAL